MPRISEFYGIVITMYYREHGVAHFHAIYGDEEASIAIDSLKVIAGSLPARALRLVREWAAVRRPQLEANWERAREYAPLEKIAPLP